MVKEDEFFLQLGSQCIASLRTANFHLSSKLVKIISSYCNRVMRCLPLPSGSPPSLEPPSPAPRGRCPYQRKEVGVLIPPWHLFWRRNLSRYFRQSSKTNIFKKKVLFSPHYLPVMNTFLTNFLLLRCWNQFFEYVRTWVYTLNSDYQTRSQTRRNSSPNATIFF